MNLIFLFLISILSAIRVQAKNEYHNNHVNHLIISLWSYLKNDCINYVIYLFRIFLSRILACKDSRFYSVQRYQ